jgi:uncharacterized protein (DUF362 family)
MGRDRDRPGDRARDGDGVNEHIDRRTFLRRSAIVGLGATLGGLAIARSLQDGEPVPWDERAFAPPGEARVAVLKQTSYDEGLESAVMDGLRATGADVRGANVLLKPNLVEYDAGTVINTDPRLVRAAALAFRRMGAASVTVGEGPGHRRDTHYVVARSGLLAAIRDAGVSFVDLNTDAVVERALRSRYTGLGRLWLPASVANADVVVSMPKMKTHHWAGVTLSLKNCFGCVPGRVYGWPKNALHWAGLEGSIVDVAAAVRSDLAIVDGIVGMEGNGPISGTPVDSGVLVFGDDPVATDTITAGLMGLDPTRIDYLQQAARFLGQGNLERIRDEGEDPASLATTFALPPGFGWLTTGSGPRPAGTAQAPA